MQLSAGVLRTNERMTSEATIVAMLENMLRDPATLPEDVSRFQAIVWEAAPGTLASSPQGERLLRDLAYDLDFFVDNPKNRAEDAAYFGRERALAEIREALDKVRDHGA